MNAASDDTAPRNDPVASPVARRFPRFSIGSVLLWLAIAGLAVNHFVNARRLADLRSDLEAVRRDAAERSTETPSMSLDEVRRRLEQLATVGPIRSKVNAATYSTDASAILVDHTWNVSTTGDVYRSSLTLQSDGFGGYRGRIENEAFLAPLGRTSPYPIVLLPESRR